MSAQQGAQWTDDWSPRLRATFRFMRVQFEKNN
jgi:hypothetical protein